MDFAVLIIEKQQFLGREARATISRTFDIIGHTQSIPNDNTWHKPAFPDLVIACIAGHRDFQRDLMTIKRLFPGARIAVIAEGFDQSEINEAIAAGAAAYLLNDLSPKALLGALTLAATGDVVLLAGRQLGSAAPALLPPLNYPARQTSVAPGAADLSPRETTILGLVKGGDSNKHIARKLGIAEATVKCHVKAILRKINVRNRFDAAMWALRFDDIERQRGTGRSDAIETDTRSGPKEHERSAMAIGASGG